MSSGDDLPGLSRRGTWFASPTAGTYEAVGISLRGNLGTSLRGNQSWTIQDGWPWTGRCPARTGVNGLWHDILGGQGALWPS